MNAPTSIEESRAIAAAVAETLDAMFARAWSEIAPPEPLNFAEWAERYRELSEEETAMPGRFDLENTPALRGILITLSDPAVRKGVCQKAAQVAWTSGVICNVLGYHMHWRPSVQVVLFPREKSSKDFAAEKLEPMIRATPPLAARVNLKSRSAGNGTTRRHYKGGLLKLVASNSPSDVKSTSGRIGIVEEPDDVNRDVGGQGNSIALLGERTKTYAPDDLQLIGGTPTAKQTSLIVREMRSTDQRRFMIPCHDCGEAHAPSWEQVTIPGLHLDEETQNQPREQLDAQWPEREVFGRARWEDAYYSCPQCGSVWTDDERIANIRRAARQAPHYGWQATAQSEVPGWHLPEFLSVFDGSRIPELARKYLVALHEFERGEPEKMVAFHNSTLALPWEYRGELPEEDELRARAEKYAEWSVPAGGLVVLLYVDVQHDRLACTVWVVGRGEEMWLSYWGEVYGRTIVPGDGAWHELEQMLQRRVRHASGAALPIAACGVDSGDGQTSDAVFDFVRKHNRRDRPVYATRGATDKFGRVEIWTSTPKDIDPSAHATKASRYGVKQYQIGTVKAKDLILGWATEGGRVRLQGNGPGRMHWYDGVRDDFYEQLLGEMKIPSRANPRLRVWQMRTDRRNEALDCTVGAVWMCRQLRLHLKRPAQWNAIEARLRQASLPAVEEPPPLVVPPEPAASDTRVPEPAVAPAPATEVLTDESPERLAPQPLATRRGARRRRGSIMGGNGWPR